MRADLPSQNSSATFKSERADANARRLRKQTTPAEKALWYALRRLPIEGSHFRRQAPFGPFIIDFLCHGARLAIEVDGGVHDVPDQALHDIERQQWIESRGYRLLRYTNVRVLNDVRAVVDEVWAEIRMRRGSAH